jgi:phosphotriesterase-related protein
VARICSTTGLKAVHATGAHHGGHYADGHWLTELSADAMAEQFIADVTTGLPAEDGPTRGRVALTPDGAAPVRAGLVKAAARYWRIDPFERRSLAAAAATSQATGVPTMVHLDHGSASWEVLEVLGRAGLSPDRVALAHMDRNLDPALHADLTLAGAYIGYDGMARHREAPDSALIDCLEGALARGADISRVLIGADVARSSRFVAYGGMPGLVYLPERFLPRLAASLGADVVHAVTTVNPAAFLSLNKP